MLMGLVVATSLVAAACSSGSGKTKTTTTKPPSKTIVLMTHDSFAAAPALAAFTRDTGFKVKVLKSGDAGEAVDKAILVQSHPVADAFFGVDNTFLTRALDNNLFEPYSAKGLANVPARFQLDSGHRVTPIDAGAVCVNDDLAWFGHNGHPAAPKSLSDLSKPEYRKLLVVENPASSSPGLAFLLTTIAAYGENGWHDYWHSLRSNGVRVVDGWEQAYDTDFTAGGGTSGDRPLVVSYGSDPAADVVFSGGKKTTPAVGVVPGTCFSQVEFAGVLANAKNPVGARALIDFMLTRRFQQDVPLQMYVYPVVTGTPLPPVFRRWAQQPPNPYTLSSSDIGKHRNAWIDEWTQIVLQ
jgi:thiamine transport system substrate-binding protein